MKRKTVAVRIESTYPYCGTINQQGDGWQYGCDHLVKMDATDATYEAENEEKEISKT